MHEIALSPKTFTLFRTYIYEKVGISLSDQKSTLVKGRLTKRLHHLSLNSFEAYYEHLTNDQTGEELNFFISAISTNVTSFFRESAQWKWLEGYIEELVSQKREKKIRIWSAGCSSGEEPYTILMFLHKHLPDFASWDIKILATDISTKVLGQAINGIYTPKNVEGLSPEMVRQHFEKVPHEGAFYYQIKRTLREKVMFRIYNLITDPFIFQSPFDMVFCRNVMIYFDDQNRQELIRRFSTLLPKGAPLLLGSSESLTSHRESLKLIGSSIYQKL